MLPTERVSFTGLLMKYVGYVCLLWNVIMVTVVVAARWPKTIHDGAASFITSFIMWCHLENNATFRFIVAAALILIYFVLLFAIFRFIKYVWKKYNSCTPDYGNCRTTASGNMNSRRAFYNQWLVFGRKRHTSDANPLLPI